MINLNTYSRITGLIVQLLYTVPSINVDFISVEIDTQVPHLTTNISKTNDYYP